MNIRRLKTLEIFLRTLKPEQFDIRHWEQKCGTVCCAGGWACQMPEFQALGLRLVINPKVPGPVPQVVVGENVLVHYRALMYVFELTERQADDIFNPTMYPCIIPVTPNDVADRIKEMISQ